jgi:hypothetical protein
MPKYAEAKSPGASSAWAFPWCSSQNLMLGLSKWIDSAIDAQWKSQERYNRKSLQEMKVQVGRRHLTCNLHTDMCCRPFWFAIHTAS